MSRFVASIALVMSFVFAGSANAATFIYQTDAGFPSYNISGVLTTSNILNGGTPNGYDITAIAGSMLDPAAVVSSVSLFAGNATPPGFINNPSWVDYDNSLIPGSGVTSTGGWMLQSANGFLYNLWLGNGAFNSIAGKVYLYSNDILSAPFSNIPNGPGEPGTLTVFPSQNAGETPLPAALPLFAGGLGMMGFLAARRKRKVAALAA